MSSEELELAIEPVDPTVLMQFSRADTQGNLLVRIHRRTGACDRRILRAEEAQRMMEYLARVLVEEPERI